MKIKVEYSIQRVAVSKVIEIGAVKNTHLSKEQSKKIDQLIKNELAEKLYEKFADVKPKTKLTAVH